MSQEIGWSVEAKLLYQIKQLTRALNSRTYISVFPNFASFPNPGITGTLYVDESTGDIYVWNGTSYVLLSSGITALNGLIAAAQTFAIGTAGTDFNISSVGTTHTFNFPTASATNRGLLSSADWTTFNNKQNALTNPITGSLTTNYLPKATGATTLGNSQIFDNGTNVGIGTTTITQKLTIHDGNLGFSNTAGGGEIFRIGVGITTSQIAINVGGTTGFAYSTVSDTTKGQLYVRDSHTNNFPSYSFLTDTNTGISNANGTADTLAFITGGTERMRLTAAGRLLVGTSTEGTNTVDIAGTLRSTQGANFATTSGNVTIGGTSSTRKLRVDVSTANDDGLEINNGTNAGLLIRTNTSYTYGGVAGNSMLLYQPTNNLSLFSDGGNITFHGGAIPAERMRLTGAGNLGIGTTSPSSTLDVTGTMRSTQGANFATSSGSVGIGTETINAAARMQINGNLHFDHTDGREIRSNGTGTFRISNPADAGIIELNTGSTSGFVTRINVQGGFVNSGGAGSNIITMTTASNERMRITSAGDVGIGIASPTARLHLQGGSNLLRVQGSGAQTVFETGSATDGRIEFSYNSTRKGLLNIDADHIRLQADAGNYLDFWSGGAQRMRITSSGNVLIGTTTDGGQMLQVSGTTLLSNTVTFANTNTGGVSWGNPSINGGSQIFFRSLTTNWVGLVNSSSHGIFITNTNANVLIGNLYSDSVGGVRTIVHNNGTAPTGNVTDSYQLYSADVVAGNAAPHFRTENGAVVKVYQETTGVTGATRVGGGGTNVTDSDTFDGYTIAQVVKALRNQGLLA